MASTLSLLVAICLFYVHVVQANEGSMRSNVNVTGAKKNVKNQIYFLETEGGAGADHHRRPPVVRYLREDEAAHLQPVSREQRRSLSFWSSIMSFIHCPIHNDHNPHCHHGGGGGSHSSNNSGGGGNGGGSSASGASGNGGGNNNGNGGNNSNGYNGNNGDGNGDGNNGDGGGDNNGNNYGYDGGGDNNGNNYGYDGGGGDNNGNNYGYDEYGGDGGDGGGNNGNDGDDTGDNYNSSVGNVDETSNDTDCWWGCNLNGRNSPSFFNDSEGSGGSSPIYIGFGMGVTGAAVIASLVLRKRYQQSYEADTGADQHMLSGAVAKRKKTFSEIFRNNSKSAEQQLDNTPTTSYIIA